MLRLRLQVLLLAYYIKKNIKDKVDERRYINKNKKAS